MLDSFARFGYFVMWPWEFVSIGILIAMIISDVLHSEGNYWLHCALFMDAMFHLISTASNLLKLFV